MNTWLNTPRNVGLRHLVKRSIALSALAVGAIGGALSASSQTTGPQDENIVPLPREVIDALDKTGINASIVAIVGTDGSVVLFYDPEKAEVIGETFVTEPPIKIGTLEIPISPLAFVYAGSGQGGYCPPRPTLGDPCKRVSSK